MEVYLGGWPYSALTNTPQIKKYFIDSPSYGFATNPSIVTPTHVHFHECSWMINDLACSCSLSWSWRNFDKNYAISPPHFTITFATIYHQVLSSTPDSHLCYYGAGEEHEFHEHSNVACKVSKPQCIVDCLGRQNARGRHLFSINTKAGGIPSLMINSLFFLWRLPHFLEKKSDFGQEGES